MSVQKNDKFKAAYKQFRKLFASRKNYKFEVWDNLQLIKLEPGSEQSTRNTQTVNLKMGAIVALSGL